VLNVSKLRPVGGNGSVMSKMYIGSYRIVIEEIDWSDGKVDVYGSISVYECDVMDVELTHMMDGSIESMEDFMIEKFSHHLADVSMACAELMND
jgi:hypothetical protein